MRDSPAVVRVFGVATAEACGTRAGWREATEWVARSLADSFGDQVRMEHIDLFSEQADKHLSAMELVASGRAKRPLVFVGDELLMSGGKISGPVIRRRLESLGVRNQRQGWSEKVQDEHPENKDRH